MDCIVLNSPGQNTRVGSLSPLQGSFSTQGMNPGLPHCRWILYQLSHKGSPRILKWVAYPFSRGSSWPRNGTRVSRITGRFFTKWAIREALKALEACGKKNYWDLIVFQKSHSLSEVPGLWLLILPNHFSPFFCFPHALKSFLRLLVAHGLTVKEWQAME